MKVVLISGKAEAGKDATAILLREAAYFLDMNYVQLAYGDYVKETARKIFEWDGVKDDAGRALLQWWGTECVRAKDPSFWVESVIRLAKVLPGNIDVIFVSDVRFPNEITAWEGTGFDVVTVRVERPGHVNTLTDEQRAHKSETALDNWKFDVVLSATNLGELAKEVRNNLPILLKEP